MRRLRFDTRYCALRSTERRRPRIGGPRIGRWRRLPMPSSTLIAAPGIAHTRSQRPMRTSRSNWSTRAARARARGGLAAAAAFLERSAALTPDPARRAHRALEAAATKHLAGASQEALGLLASAEAGPLDELDRARLKLLRGQIAGSAGAPRTRCRCFSTRPSSSNRLTSHLSRDAYLAAFRAVSIAGRLGPGTREVARSALEAPPATGSASRRRPARRRAGGSVHRWLRRQRACAETRARRASRGGRARRGRAFAGRGSLGASRRICSTTTAWHYLATRSVQTAREAGALGVLPVALQPSCAPPLLRRAISIAAAALLDEADGIAFATGAEPVVVGSLSLAGLRGDRSGGVGSVRGDSSRPRSRGARGSSSPSPITRARFSITASAATTTPLSRRRAPADVMNC